MNDIRKIPSAGQGILILVSIFLIQGFLTNSLKALLSTVLRISGFDKGIELLVEIVGLFAIFFILYLKRYSLRVTLGLSNIKRHLLAPALQCGIGLVIFVLSIEMILALFFPSMLKFRTYLTGQIPGNQDSWIQLTVAMLNMAAVPIIEELEFRGLFLNSLSNSWGKVKGILISALVFGAFHISPIDAFAFFLLGIGLGYLTNATGSVYFPILIHTAYNLAVVIFYLLTARGLISAERPFSTMVELIALGGGLVVFFSGVFYMKKIKKKYTT